MESKPKNVRRRIVCLTAPKEGAGKTAAALNLARKWAGAQMRGVVIVHLDPLCRNDVSPQLGITPPTFADLVYQEERVSRGGPRTLVPLSQWGVGCLPMAADPGQAARVSPAAARRALSRLSAAYDLVLDVAASSPLRRLALRLGQGLGGGRMAVSRAL